MIKEYLLWSCWVPEIRVRWRHATQPKRLKRLLFVDHPSMAAGSPSTRNVRHTFHPSFHPHIHPSVPSSVTSSIHPCILSFSLAVVEWVSRSTKRQPHKPSIVCQGKISALDLYHRSASPPSDEDCWLASYLMGFDHPRGANKGVIPSHLFLLHFVGFPFPSPSATKRGRQVHLRWLPWTLNCPSRRSSPFPQRSAMAFTSNL